MLARALPALIAIFFAVTVACGGDDGPPPPRVAPPSAPAVNDPAYAVTGVTPWNLVGNALTPGQDTLAVAVAAPTGVETIDVWVAGGPGQRLTLDDATHQFTGTLAIGALPAGEHALLFAADSGEVAFARATFIRTHPLYFFVSTDWDFADPGDVALAAHDRLRTAHPGIRFTQFVGPYTYTDPMVTVARQAELTTWLTTRRDQFGDEIGLHIHPWCHFVTSAGLPCITDQSTVYATDATGYTIKLAAYGQKGLETLLTRADALFAEHGLGKPVTFRAGGWTASVENLAALAGHGYVADTSALNWARIEEWTRPSIAELWRWNMETWSTIGDTSQPYYPNVTDKQSPAPPNLPILEVPDNAVMVDYVTKEEMKSIFTANWGGGPLAQPTTYMMGFHPSSSWTSSEYNRADGILDHADQFLADRHAGPVVYALLRDMPTVWPSP